MLRPPRRLTARAAPAAAHRPPPAPPPRRDRRFEGDQAAFDALLAASTTVYVGNLSFFTTEDQIHEVFSKAGDVKRIVMGLDKQRRTPCGFAFVVYYTRADAEACVRYVNGTALDDRPVRADFDWGFVEGRQFGRGRSGGQVRDEYRMDYDGGRGGFGTILKQELEAGAGRGMAEEVADEMGGGGGGGAMGGGAPEEKRFRRDESDDER